MCGAFISSGLPIVADDITERLPIRWHQRVRELHLEQFIAWRKPSQQEVAIRENHAAQTGQWRHNHREGIRRLEVRRPAVGHNRGNEITRASL